MQIRCYRCGFSFSLSRETLAAAMANLTVTGNTHHIEHCPRCRSANKIPRQLIARSSPPVTEEALAAARAALEAAPAEPVKQTPYRAPVSEPEPEKKKNKHHRRRSEGEAELATAPVASTPAPIAAAPPAALERPAVTEAEEPPVKSAKPAPKKPAAKKVAVKTAKPVAGTTATKSAKPASGKTAAKAALKKKATKKK